MADTYSRPSSSFGYWRGGMSDGPLAQNQGSRRFGQADSGVGIFPQGSGAANPGRAWSPTLTYLLVFTVAEMIAFGLLARALR
jgi:hypothetical protein